jgi:hypothetical protein
MSSNWSQEKYCGSTQAKREAEMSSPAHAKSLVPMPTPQSGRPLTNRVVPESLPGAAYTQWRTWFIGWNVMIAALAGVVIFFLLNVASLGFLSSAVTVAVIVAALGFGHYLIWGRVFAQGMTREMRQVQDQARLSETSETAPPDEFLLALNDRERMELLQLLEHSLAGTTGGREESGDSAALRRKLRDKIRRFGA